MAEQINEVTLSTIKVGERYRKDMGDLDALADSIRTVGLLQPIGITSNYQLIWGHRRLEAYRLSGMDKIPARIVPMEDIVQGEYAENEVRKDFTVSERVAIAKVVEKDLEGRRG